VKQDLVCEVLWFSIFLCVIARLRKPEMIIRENQPIELPPEVVRGRVPTCVLCAVQMFALYMHTFH